MIALIPAILAQPVPLRCQVEPNKPRACEARPAGAVHRNWHVGWFCSKSFAAEGSKFETTRGQPTEQDPVSTYGWSSKGHPLQDIGGVRRFPAHKRTTDQTEREQGEIILPFF